MGHIVWQKHRFYCIVSRDLLSNIRQAAPTKPRMVSKISEFPSRA